MKQTTKKQQSPFQQRMLQTVIDVGGRLFPRIVAHYAYRLWFRAPRFQSPGRELQWREHATASVIDHSGLPLTVYRWGEGPVVLLVHGWSGRALQLGGIAVALAQSGYQAVAIDLPAHGDTPGSHTNAFAMAAAIKAVVQYYGMVHGIVTHSFGVIPVSMLLRQGIPVDKVVCISPPDNGEYLLGRFVQAMRFPPKVVTHLHRQIEQVFGDSIWDEISVDKNVAGLTLPALIIHDENDRDVEFQRAEVLARAWSGASFYRTRGLGHRRILRDEATIEQVCRFIASASTNQ